MVPSDAVALEYASTANGPAQQFIANTILGNDNSQNLDCLVAFNPKQVVAHNLWGSITASVL